MVISTCYSKTLLESSDTYGNQYNQWPKKLWCLHFGLLIIVWNEFICEETAQLPRCLSSIACFEGLALSMPNSSLVKKFKCAMWGWRWPSQIHRMLWWEELLLLFKQGVGGLHWQPWQVKSASCHWDIVSHVQQIPNNSHSHSPNSLGVSFGAWKQVGNHPATWTGHHRIDNTMGRCTRWGIEANKATIHQLRVEVGCWGQRAQHQGYFGKFKSEEKLSGEQ